MLEIPIIFLFIATVPMQIGEVIEDEIEGMIDITLEKIDVPENNPLNTTKAETDELKESGFDTSHG